MRAVILNFVETQISRFLRTLLIRTLIATLIRTIFKNDVFKTFFKKACPPDQVSLSISFIQPLNQPSSDLRMPSFSGENNRCRYWFQPSTFGIQTSTFAFQPIFGFQSSIFIFQISTFVFSLVFRRC